jgi:MHS family shikimate/dehydroshikimate transporter-like MFS transporter
VSAAILAYPLFWALDGGSPPLILWALLLSLVLGHAAMYAPQGAFFSELFGTRVRYSGASLGVQLSSVLAGGLSPIIATRLLQLGYGRGALSLYLIGMAAITIVSVALATETLHHDIERTENVANV